MYGFVRQRRSDGYADERPIHDRNHIPIEDPHAVVTIFDNLTGDQPDLGGPDRHGRDSANEHA